MGRETADGHTGWSPDEGEPEVEYSEDGLIKRFIDPLKQIKYEHLLRHLGSISSSPLSKRLPALTIARMEEAVARQIQELIEGTDSDGPLSYHAQLARSMAYWNEADDMAAMLNPANETG